MKERSARNYLQDMLAELDDIRQFTQDGRLIFMTSHLIQKGVIRSYEVIGAIIKLLPQEIRDSNPQIDWRKLAAFRDFLAHHYDTVNLDNVWIAVEDLSNLRSQLELLLDSLPPDSANE
jgi:uncharacterized protein with HEPN domain